MSELIYVEAPNYLTQSASSKSWVFLAGGITGCPNWQKEFSSMLYAAELPLVVCNPRRENFPIKDPNAAGAQIKWEFEHLQMADAIVFWFPAEGLQPIAMYELGYWLNSTAPIFLGVEHGFWREQDIMIQVPLARSEIKIVHTLPELAEQVGAWAS